MRREIYSVYDNVANVYNMPFFAINNAFAKRDFENSIKRADTLLSTNPNDFDLYCLGGFDDSTGYVTSYECPFKILSGAEVKQKYDAEFNKELDERLKEGR